MIRSAPRFLAGLFLGLLACAAHAVQQDLIFVFDNSGSMRKADPDFAAREEAKKFLAGLTGDIHAGVIVFDQNVKLTAPLAPVGEGSALAQSLDSVDYRGRFTDSPAAVERAIYELKTKGRPDAQKSVVFMTDGIVDTGNRQQDAERTRWLREDLAADAVLNGIRIHGIAFTGAADLLLIQSLAAKTSAEYFRAATPAELPAALAKVQEALRREPPPEVATLAEPAPAPTPAAPAPAAETPVPAPAEAVAPPAPAQIAGGPALSAEEMKSLEQLSKETGVPVEQLIKELESAQPGETVVMRPEPSAEEAATPALSIGKLGAIGGAILAVLVALWLMFRHKGDAPKQGAPKPTIAPPAAGAQPGLVEAWLVDINGLSGEGPRKIGEKPLMIGRIAGSDPDYLDYYVVNKATVGRRHAVIRAKDRAYWLVDQGSVNGTFVNDEKVLGERQLRHGDRLKFHKFEFEFQCPDGANQTVVGMPADHTIVASMDQTLAAVATTSSAGFGAGTVTRAAGAAAAGAAAAPLAEDLFGGDFDERGDANDVTAVDEDLQALEADKTAFFTDSGAHAAAAGHERTEALQPPDARPDDFDIEEEPETLAVGDLLKHADFEPPPEDFEAQASDFFDDVTVHPAPDLLSPDLANDLADDVLDITVARTPSFPGGDIPESEDFATATTVMPAAPHGLEGTARPLGTATFGQMDTVLGSPSSLDDGDETLEDFLATSSIDDVPQPPDSPLPAAGDGVGDFFADAPELTTNDLAELAASVAADEVFDVTGEVDTGGPSADAERTTVLPASPVDTPPQIDTVVLPNSPYANKPKP
ncbi:MAG TPA: VWA domain-containing protein [Gammaproteobacteria bacterium]|nr:VWA domain-containing protein [Gammaproteobacteria bacterium]